MDSEEFVIRKAINAMSALTELGLLHKSALYELLKDTACFLIHPNLWIRQVLTKLNYNFNLRKYLIFKNFK